MLNRFESFTTYIIELYRAIQKIKEIEMNKIGLKAGHTMCLYHLGENEKGLTITQLSELCREDKAAVSRSVSQLEKQGIVYIERNELKRSYRSPIVLTENGKQFCRIMNARIDDALINGGGGLSDTHRETLYKGLEQIMNNLYAYIENINESSNDVENSLKK